ILSDYKTRGVFLYFYNFGDVSGTFSIKYDVQPKLTKYNKIPSYQRFKSRDTTVEKRNIAN
ncbi:hypothetical protein ACJB7Y_000001, partial [Staphylococcus pseudintermedius]